MTRTDGPRPATRGRLHRLLPPWANTQVLGATAVTAAAGFAQFGAVAALGDVAATFGELGDADTLAARAGLSATTLGVGLAAIRLASLVSLPLAALGDRAGRRRVLLGCVTAGLAITAMASLSPGYWWFVVIFALGRPLLSTANAIAGVVAAEETSAASRARALALVAAGYGVGAGTTALVRGAFADTLGFRGLFALIVIPLLLVPLLARVVQEPTRFREVVASTAVTSRYRRWIPGRVPSDVRPRLLALGAGTFAVAFITGPVNSLLFVYAENVLGITPGIIGALVFAAAPVGLTGLLLGRWLADHAGRRVTAAVSHGLIAVAGVATYSGSTAGVIAGYLASMAAQSAYGVSAGPLATELFPTSVRATSAGWLTVCGVLGAVSGLVAFGLLADLLDGFTAAAAVVAVPVVLSAAVYALLPETRGLELEQSAPEPAV